jgi:hypothetical protein
MWLQSTFVSYTTTFPTFKRSMSSCLLATTEVVGRTQILQSRCIVHRLLESSNSYMWFRSTFLSYPTSFLTFKKSISSCLNATIEIVGQAQILSSNPSHVTVTCGYDVLFSLIPLLSLLLKDLYHLVYLP